MSGHHCHARAGKVSTKPEMLMCFRHWKLVPRRLQRGVWNTYRDGHDDKCPSDEWHTAADAAIGFVAALEDRPLLVSEINALNEAGYRTREQGGKLVVELA